MPSWVADDKGGARLINARADGVADKPSFRDAFRKRRCLIPAMGFYEWAAVGRVKQPFHFRRHDGKSFLFAGLWERWGDGLLTACLITTDGNGTVSPVHNRMPVILTPEAVATWLDLKSPRDHVEAVLRPAPDDLLEAMAVSKLVNSPKNDGPECMESAGAA